MLLKMLLLLSPLILVVPLKVALDLRRLNEGQSPLNDAIWNLLIICLLSTTSIILVDGELGDVCDGYTHVRVRPLYILHSLRLQDNILSINNAAPKISKGLAGAWILHMTNGYHKATDNIFRSACLLRKILNNLRLNYAFTLFLDCLLFYKVSMI